jgi:hypothetical protein
MIFMQMQNPLMERRRADDQAFREAHGNKVRRSNMLMCTATNPDLSFEMRLEAFKTALEIWQGDEFGTKNIERQCPAFLAILRMKGQA